MPGTPSGMTGAYGPGSQSIQGPLISTLNTGARGSPTPHHVVPNHAPVYPYGATSSIGRRPPVSYGLPHPLSSSPQSNGSTSVNVKHNSHSLAIAEKSRRESSQSPMQALGPGPANASPKMTWQASGNNAPSQYHAVAGSIGANDNGVRHSSDILSEWSSPNPRHMFQTSSSITSASGQARGISAFALNNGNVSGISYTPMNPEASSFHRQSPEGPILAPSPWPALSSGANPLRPTPHTPGGSGEPSTGNGSGPGFLEPLLLSQPYDHRSVSSDGPISAGATNGPSPHPAGMQASLSQYGDREHYDNIGHSVGYVNEEGADLEGRGYSLEGHDQQWQSGMH